MTSEQMEWISQEEVGMSTFLIESTHTPQECTEAMNQVSMIESDVLKNAYWGCHYGEHKGWMIIEASSQSEAVRAVPASLRNKATIVEVEQMTPEEIRQAHS
jgi:hypothetical protein